MSIVETIESARSGILQIAYERNRQRVGNGSGFLVPGGIVTNSHVINPAGQVDAFALRFSDTDAADGNSYIRLLPGDCQNQTRIESPVGASDFAFIEWDEPEFASRHRFEFGDSSDIRVGEQIVFLGFPFGMPQLTAHVGWVSSIHTKDMVPTIQIDGSVNGGNSGGPVIDPKSGMVIGIVTRAVTGFIEEEFDRLIVTLKNNQELLAQSGGVTAIVGGVNPREGFRASQAAMEQIARNLKRSANVGIGYAYSTNELRDRLQQYKA